MNTSPLEHDECVTFVQWMEVKKLMFTHIPNETYTTSWNQKRKNKAEGVKKGFPDYVIVIPKDKSKRGKSHLLLVEMKRRKGGKATPEQLSWIAAMNDIENIQAVVCKGAEDAISFISNFLKE